MGNNVLYRDYLLTLPPSGFYLITLSLFIPLPLNKGKGEGFRKEGLTPLLNTPHF